MYPWDRGKRFAPDAQLLLSVIGPLDHSPPEYANQSPSESRSIKTRLVPQTLSLSSGPKPSLGGRSGTDARLPSSATESDTKRFTYLRSETFKKDRASRVKGPGREGARSRWHTQKPGPPQPPRVPSYAPLRKGLRPAPRFHGCSTSFPTATESSRAPEQTSSATRRILDDGGAARNEQR